MKTLIKPLLLALSLGIFTASVSISEAKPIRPTKVASYKTGIFTSTDGKLHIALDKQTGGAVEIQLKNDAGNVVYNRHLGKNESKYRTRLNLSELPDGVYKVEITNGVETTTQTVTLATQFPTTPSRLVAVN